MLQEIKPAPGTGKLNQMEKLIKCFECAYSLDENKVRILTSKNAILSNVTQTQLQMNWMLDISVY